jgi:hypothetical protein
LDNSITNNNFDYNEYGRNKEDELYYDPKDCEHDDVKKKKTSEYSNFNPQNNNNNNVQFKSPDITERDKSFTDANAKYKKWFIKENNNILSKPNGKPTMKLNLSKLFPTNNKFNTLDTFVEEETNIQLEKYDASAVSFVYIVLIIRAFIYKVLLRKEYVRPLTFTPVGC